jgi:concanavalin A-like lectin/glucanase superfamily protein
MRKLLTFLIALGAVAVASVSGPVRAGCIIGGGFICPPAAAASNWCTLIPQSGLVNCWPYDTAHTTSGTATDLIGSKNSTQTNVTLNGSGPSTNLNNAAVFDGSTSHGDTPGPASSTPPPRAAFSVVYWINPTGLGASGNQRVIANDHTGGADNNGIAFYYATGADVIEMFVGNGTTSLNAVTTAPTNTWTMITLTYDSTTLIPYVGTTAGTSITLAGPVATPTNALGFGYNPAYAGDFYGGMLAGVAVYNRALTSGEITTINGL